MVGSVIQLSPGEVHLWIQHLEIHQAAVQQHQLLLSAEELARSKRFIHQKDHDSYVLSHGTARRILARYLQVSPDEIAFEYEQFGKPRLVRSLNPQSLDFNLSHSGNWFALALVLNARIGVDIEAIRPESASLDVAARFFTPWENEELESLSGHDQVLAFFNCWTRKEAYLKAIGCGLSVSPLDCEVTLKPGDEPKIRRCVPSDSPEGRWSILNSSSSDFIAAVAVELNKPSLKIKSG